MRELSGTRGPALYNQAEHTEVISYEEYAFHARAGRLLNISPCAGDYLF
jgi:hypothetical protein